jgi:hypothetical protein
MVWFDLILLGIWAGVTWAVASQGMWGAALMLFNVLFAGLLAMNFFEPAANLMASVFGEAGNYWYDLTSLMLLFIVAVFLLRMLTDNLSPLLVRFTLPLDQAGRWVLALWTGWLTIGFLATAVHTAPLPRDFIGFSPEREKFLGWHLLPAPDHQWLAYTQRCSEKLFDRGPKYRFDVWQGEKWDRASGQSQGASPRADEAARLFIARYATRRAQAAGGAAPATSGGTTGGGGAGGLSF